MSQFLQLVPPDEARILLLSHLSDPLNSDTAGFLKNTEIIDSSLSLGRVSAEDILAPQSLPEFQRSSVDGFAVRAVDTFGATESMPAYLDLIGEISMGESSSYELKSGQCVSIHTGGMVPKGADAVVMLEYAQEINQKVAGGRGTEKTRSSTKGVFLTLMTRLRFCGQWHWGKM